MKRALSVLVLLGGLGAAPPVRAEGYFPVWPTALQTDVTRIARGFKGEFALYIKDLSTGARYTSNSATPMYLASGIKLAVMIALFKQVHANEISLDEELIYTEQDLRDGSPLLNFIRYGTPISLQLLLEAMIQQSDNAATDMIINRIGLESVDRTLVEEELYGFGPITSLLEVRRLAYRDLDPRTKSFGPKEIFQLGVTRPLEERLHKLGTMLGEVPTYFTVAAYDRAFRRYYESGYNSGSMDSMAALLEGLARGKLISPGHSRQMVELMLGTQTGTRRIRAGLPPNTPWAHKTGTQYQRMADFGIFYMPDGRAIVIAFTVKNVSRKQSEEVMARVASRAYWHLATPGGRAAKPVKLSREEEDLLAPDAKKKRKPSRARKKRGGARLRTPSSAPSKAAELSAP